MTYGNTSSGPGNNPWDNDWTGGTENPFEIPVNNPAGNPWDEETGLGVPSDTNCPSGQGWNNVHNKCMPDCPTGTTRAGTLKSSST